MILIGSSASAVDISRDICPVAKEVHVSSRSAPDGQPASRQPGYDNMWLHSMVKYFILASEYIGEILNWALGTGPKTMLISTKHSMQIKSAHDDGTVVFPDGSSVLADVILHCTGYVPQSLIQVKNQSR